MKKKKEKKLLIMVDFEWKQNYKFGCWATEMCESKSSNTLGDFSSPPGNGCQRRAKDGF